MPRQTVPKAQRMLLVLEAIREVGLMEAPTLIAHVADRLKVNVSKKFKMQIYRDLDELERLGQVICRRKTLSGEDIPPEETAKNFRAEYCAPEGNVHIYGGGLLRNAGAELLVRPVPNVGFRVDSSDMVTNGPTIQILDRTAVVSIRVQADQIPATVVIARMNQRGDPVPSLDELKVRFGARACFLLWKDPTLSRFRPHERLGHAALGWIDDPRRPFLQDLGSTEGTFVSASSEDETQKLVSDFQSKQSIGTGPAAKAYRTMKNREWRPIGNERQKLSTLPVFIRFGEWIILVR